MKKQIFIAKIKKGIKATAEYITLNNSQGDGYCSQRNALIRLFQMTSGDGYNESGVLLRLTALDAMYSTNARMAIFSLEKLTEEILNLGTEYDAMAYFQDVLDGKTSVEESLFKKELGWQKNKPSNRSLPSLVSKYAYFQAIVFKEIYPNGFPIYDDLVCQVLPACIEGCSTTALKEDLSTFFFFFLDFCSNLKLSAEDTKGLQPYDAIDAYLWRIGKLYSGNISLIVDEKDYGIIMGRICPLKVSDGKKEDESFYKIVKEHYSNNLFKGIKNETLLNLIYKHYKDIYEDEEKNV